MPIAAVQLTFCVGERLDKWSDDHRVYAEACTLYQLE